MIADLSSRNIGTMHDRPNVHIVASSAPPGGVGESGVPPIAPAIFAANGKRIRALPVDPALLKAS